MKTATQRLQNLQWLALLLLAISVCINYADRSSLGVAARNISLELHLRPDQLGYLLAAFSLTYSLCQVVSGKVIERWNVNWAYAAGFLLWSVATGLTGVANTFAVILVLRLILGLSESVAYPAYSKMIVISFPEQLRGTANALIDAGSKLGPALGVLFGVQMVESFTWRGMFLILGGASLLWLIPWSLVARKLPSTPKQARGAPDEAPSYREILSKRTMWGTAIGLFGGNYTWFVFLNWLPYYFETERHYTRNSLAVFGSLPFWTIAASSMLFGVVADGVIKRYRKAGRNANPGRIRQVFVCLGLLGCCALMLPAVAVANRTLANTLLLLASVSMGAWSSNHWALTQFLAGPRAAGKWTAIQNGLGNLAGVAGQIASGYALKATHSFFEAFAIACGVLLVGVLSYWFVVGIPSESHWKLENDPNSRAAEAPLRASNLDKY